VEEAHIMAKKIRQRACTRMNPKTVPDSVKRELSRKAEMLVKDHLAPLHVKPAPNEPKFNYIVDILTKWRGRYFYFIAKYATPEAEPTKSFFEYGFARLEFTGDGRFDLAYFRHTGKWWPLFTDLSLDQALESVRSDGLFMP